ncbi:hypothetical protein BDW22DRAFT_810466 [Trametopsis cervina]|nr:hypothetical protein BDW22DRAFT_810466 [Trametopsis cervina]
MGIHLYDKSTTSHAVQHIRLAPARSILKAGIPCTIYAEDALDFMHFVPTGLFTLQILVPDESIGQAATAVTSNGPYSQMTEPITHWREMKLFDPAQPNCFPSSIALQQLPETVIQNPSTDEEFYVPSTILIHPQSSFHFNMSDSAAASPLPTPPHPEDSSILFPTICGFLDSLIATIHEPATGIRMHRLELMLRCYIGYLFIYSPQLRTYPRVLPDGSYIPSVQAVYDGLKEENKRMFAHSAHGSREAGAWEENVIARRNILRQMGRLEEADCPMPRESAAVAERTCRSALLTK